jgi:hypothetical protein
MTITLVDPRLVWMEWAKIGSPEDECKTLPCLG